MGSVIKKFRDLTGQAGSQMKTIEEVKVELQNIPTTDLAIGFVEIKDFHKKVKDFTEAVRDEIKDNRMFKDEQTSVDGKGHGYIDAGEHAKVKAERRVLSRLNQERAKEFLDETGIEGAIDVEFELYLDKDEVIVFDTIVAVLESQGDSYKELIDEVKKIRNKIEVVETVNEEKLEALSKLEEITPDELISLYDVTESYALKVMKKKK